MADLLSTGLTGLRAFQRALETTSHNIANATTPGYSRQRVEIGTRPAQLYGSGWIGQGAIVQTTRRMYDDYIAMQTRNASGTLQRLDVFASNTERLNNMFGNATTGLTATLQNFVNAFQNVANSPTSIPARQTLLSEAQSLQQRLRYFESTLADMDAEVNFRLRSDVTDINAIAQSLAKLNEDIVSAYAHGSGQPPNDLLDQRDRLLDELAAKVALTTVKAPNGAIDVFIGNGQTLVLGSVASELTTIEDQFDPARLGIGVRTSGGVVDVTRAIAGGSLGGMLDFRREQLDPARNELGRVSIALTQLVNEQHQAGIDLSGAMGKPLFAVGEVQVLPSRENMGTGSLTVTRGDAANLSKRDYVLELTTSGWQMRYADTGEQVALTGDGTAANPFVIDGMRIEVNPGAQIGDEFLLRPTRTAISGMQVLIDEPSEIAAAAPIRTAAGANNLGTGAISAGSVIDRTHPALTTPVTIEFIDASTYMIGADGPFSYAAGQPIEYNGWRVEITGAPEAGDTFTVGPNTSGSGDNRNALLLADALQRPILNNGTTSLSAGVGALVSGIGVATRQAQANRDAQQVVYQESAAALDSVAGVNLDEEAANLIKYQQAYQAAAQLIRIADTLFETLLNAAGRA
jgi:flagellar hook-associated protein 1 FlgK